MSKKLSPEERRLQKRGHPVPYVPPVSFITCDPGTKNFFLAWTKKAEVRHFHHVKSAVQSLPSGMLRPHLRPFLAEFHAVLATTRAKHVLVEKFASRNFGSSNTEFISTMIGALEVVCASKNVTLELVTASEWKVALKKIMDYDILVKSAKKHGVAQHIVDCICTSRYVLSGYRYKSKDRKWIKRQLKKVTPLPIFVETFK